MTVSPPATAAPPAVELETIACPVCGGQSSSVDRRIREWTIVRCQGCGLAYLNPRPTRAALTRLYDTEYFAQEILKKDTDTWDKLSDLELARHLAAFGETVSLIERYQRRGSLLDVGCGLGLLLHAARARGWQVRGLDLAEAAVQYARQKFDLDVRIGDAFDVKIDEGPYDVVCLQHTLEHLPDPVGVLKHLFNVVRPGGLLVIDVPNYGSLDAKLLGDTWEGLSLPYHLNHFEPKTVAAVARAAGLAPIALEHELSYPAIEAIVAVKRLFGRQGEPSLADTTSGAPLTSDQYAESTFRNLTWRRRVMRRVRHRLTRILTGRDMTLIARRVR